MTCECGKELVTHDKVVGGQNVAADAYNFHTYVTYQTSAFTDITFCGGSLINDLYVITSRRCITVSFHNFMFPEQFFEAKIN